MRSTSENARVFQPVSLQACRDSQAPALPVPLTTGHMGPQFRVGPFSTAAAQGTDLQNTLVFCNTKLTHTCEKTSR